jgi:hypothetical protein
VLVLHRWRDRHALYTDYLDHTRTHVSYITTSLGRPSVPPGSAAVVLVPATDDLVRLRHAVRDLVARFGVPERVVALNEGDLDAAAALRAELGCAGQQPAELARFRDKLEMVTRVAGAGIRVPTYADAPDVRSVVRFARHHGWPLIVKPRRGTASRAVTRLDSPRDLRLLDGLADEPRLVQEFIPDPIFHVDGLWTGTALGPWRASRYINTCAQFGHGRFLGSVEVDDPALTAHLEGFLVAVAGALSDQPWVFHLEIFVGPEEGAGPRLTFLEAGARVGGAEIPFLWREVHGIDLMAAAADLQLGREPRLAALEPGEVGGWLLMPVPVPPPCRVVEATVPMETAGAAYARVIPGPGAVIPRVGGYEHVGARFRFRGPTSAGVEAAIQKTAAEFRLHCMQYPDGEALP